MDRGRIHNVPHQQSYSNLHITGNMHNVDLAVMLHPYSMRIGHHFDSSCDIYEPFYTVLHRSLVQIHYCHLFYLIECPYFFKLLLS